MFSANSSQVSEDKLFVEDVFSTWLYQGNGSTQTITNGIDLAGKGGMLWIKNRNASSDPLHYLNFNDGSNIVSNNSNNASAKQVMSPYVAFNSNGFFVNAAPGFLNNSSVNYASWTFRKAPKFFDVVTYTGNGNDRTIAHNLGSVPGCIIVKRTDTTGSWRVYHRSIGASNYLVLSSTAASAAGSATWNDTAPTSTTFSLGTTSDVNSNGGTYVAYLFAHDATADGIIQCGSYTEGASDTQVTLGWEPQWLLTKKVNGTSNWWITDTMRGMSYTGERILQPNTATTEDVGSALWPPTPTGFIAKPWVGSGSQVIYIAIRRGPMRTPTSGTSVFNATASSGASGTQITTNFPVDTHLAAYRDGDSFNFSFTDRLRGMLATNAVSGQKLLVSSSTGAEQAGVNPMGYEFWNTGWRIGSYLAGASSIYYSFRRAPSFMDTVCWTNSSTTSITTNHSLGVVPEMVIVKRRGPAADGWMVRHKNLPSADSMLFLNSAGANSTGWTGYSSTATTLTYNTYGNIGDTYVAYLFGTAPGVSKVGSYTGNGSSQTINCGFAAGARFVMIKRTDSTGSWWVWDVARGLVSGNDPALQLNSTAAETTGIDSIDPDSSGFIVNQDATTNINVSGGTYIYMSVA